MVSRESQLSSENYKVTDLILKKWEPDPYYTEGQDSYRKPQTPSEWFSNMFPEQAKRYGTPFIEHLQPIGDGINSITPLSLNTDFFGAILGGDSRLAHRVLYVELEMAWYYYDCRDKIYKQTTDEKLGNLLRALMLRCAEELPGNVHKLNLFLEFRSDKTVRSILHRAKSILAADDSFFSVDSKNERQQGPELYERVARQFVEQVLERQAGEILTLGDAYIHFLEYLKKRRMEPVNRRVFKSLVPPAVKEEYDLGIRKDLVDAEKKWTSGWKGIKALEVEPVAQN